MKSINISNMKRTVKQLILNIIPYIIILICSFLPFIYYFKIGNTINTGDDIYFHLMWVYDLESGFSNGFTSSPGHNLFGNLGYGVYLFYGALSHYMVAIIHHIIPSISIVTSWKIVIIVTTMLSGIWTYWLGKKVTNNDICALMIALIMVFNPYRIENIFYRAAFPEAIAISFMPLVFLGVYELSHKDYRPIAFVHCIVGVSCVIFCHPFTGMVTVFSALVYLILNYKGFVGLFTSKRNIFYTCSTIILIICLLGFYIFPMYKYTSSGLYNISNSTLMHTNAEYIAKTVDDSLWRGGFLRYNWIAVLVNQYGMTNTFNESWSSWMGDYIIFSCLALGSLILFMVSKKLKNKKIKIPLYIFSSLLPLLSLLFSNRPEMFIIVPIFCVSILYIAIYKDDKWTLKLIKKDLIKNIKEPGVYFLFIELIVCCVLLFNGDIWKYMPSIMYNVQFAFRMWSIVIMLTLMLVLILIKPFANMKVVQIVLASCVVIVFLSNMGIIDKRFCYQSNWSGRNEPTVQDVINSKNQGWQNEYLPQVFRDSSYESEYDNSLYKTIRNQIYGSRPRTSGINEYINPVYLEGNGWIKIETLNSPEATFDVVVDTETSLIQLPQIYYEGYEMIYTVDDTTYRVKGENVDGLVSFRLTQGDYIASLKWVGTKSYQIFKPLFYVGVAGTSCMLIIPAILNYFNKKEHYKLKINKKI